MISLLRKFFDLPTVAEIDAEVEEIGVEVDDLQASISTDEFPTIQRRIAELSARETVLLKRRQRLTNNP